MLHINPLRITKGEEVTFMAGEIIPKSIVETLTKQVQLLVQDSDYNPENLRENALAINEIAKTFITANRLF